MMEIKTYRAATLQDALQLVRQELGPDAAVLRAREVAGSLWQRLRGQWQIEVTAATDVAVPPRIPRELTPPPFVPTSTVPTTNITPSPITPSPIAPSPIAPRPIAPLPISPTPIAPAAWTPRQLPANQPSKSPPNAASSREAEDVYGRRRDASTYLSREWPLLDELTRRPLPGPRLPASVFDLFVDLLDAELGDDLARELIEEARGLASDHAGNHAGDHSGNDIGSEAGKQVGDEAAALKARLVDVMESRIATSGPIAIVSGRRRVVALVGPTGVGKTTTLAKLAANFRLRERRRVGLVTVDTYRIAAVEQLRTYAEIIDLPMEVVSNPSDMRRALDRLGECDLVLLDTAGRSPRDEVRIQELKSILEEARADEVHLVLSAASGCGPMRLAAERFAPAGVTSLLLTKLDEAATLGPAFAWLQRSGHRLSYLTHGQNVPDDIAVADSRRFVQRLLAGNRDVVGDTASFTGTRAGEMSQP
jgi:flagellar biosynthesis protein FlhF